MSETIKDQFGWVTHLKWFCMTPTQRALVAQAVKHEEEILQIMMVLPGKYRYEQVEAAVNASGIFPRGIYMSLAANERTFALLRFYEALNGPGWSMK